MAIEFPDGTQLVITRTVARSPERVFEAFTDSEQMARWIWGPNAPGAEVVCDARVGGRWSAYMDAPEGESQQWPGEKHGMRGVFAVVDRPERIVYTLNWDAPVGYNVGVDPSTLTDEAVVIDFKPSGEGTIIAFRHLGIPDDGVSVHEHAKGVDATLDTLEQLLGSGG
jgi:uncharacterized protein YndB with AHSA1/START domain